ncbi:sugar ABC transporter ATP-binding protein [Actinocorallia sp. A-T 12471]|uniref:sugar ABC transporter ATP-binding protein n=1 Tax=Actinocorallia sp. A-T 12471 TaxID=3089813 RepID=UPI0029D14467|nr:sugar ABC transporter ATP-binding protein [Actinocorallia sp. A-T 12471]MDX6742411.1 sugar ABC transporter ATP-binding protein [Actinocorallia sp. A-T 12471]
MSSSTDRVTDRGTGVPPVLRVERVAKSFGPVAALRDASLTVARGEVVCLAGENGSGKSTLSKIIAGALAPDSGTVELDGVPVRFAGPRQALEAGVCLVSQEPTLVPALSVAENVMLARLGGPMSRVRRARLVAAAEPLLARVGLRLDPRRPAESLPPGDRELVALAQALAADPRLLILDEVTARLPDPERLYAVVEPLAASGVGVVLITHRLPEMRRLAHRASVLRDGVTVAELGGHELSDDEVSRAMVGRDLGDYFPARAPGFGGVRLDVRGLVTVRSPHALSLSVRAGEIVGLAGLVGSGRSELLETLAGLRRPVRGGVEVDGTPLTGPSPRAARRAGVVLVPEDRFAQGLAPAHSIRDNLAAPWLRTFGRTDRAADHTRAEKAVAAYRVRCDGVGTPVAALSGGNAQKVVIARALGDDPRVLLLDEPTRGVDIGARADIYRAIADLAAAGCAVLMASSDLVELLGLADRIIVLADGDARGELSRAQASEEAIALLALGGGEES